MMRLFRYIIIFAIVILLLFGSYFWFSKERLIANFLSKQLKADVQVEKFHLGWKNFSLQNLSITKSKLYSFEGNLKLQTYFWNFFKNPLHLYTARIQDGVISINVFGELKSEENLLSYVSLTPSSKEKQTFIIDQLVLENLQLRLVTASKKTLKTPKIPYLEFNDLGKNKPLSTAEIIQSLLRSLLSKEYRSPLLTDSQPSFGPENTNSLKY